MALTKGYKAGDLQVEISGIADSATKSIENVIDSLFRLQNQMTQTMAVLKADGTSFTKTFKNFSKNGFEELLDQQNKSAKSTAKSLSFFKAIGKIGMVVKGAMRLGKEVVKIAQKGAEYTETLNLWEVAMRDNVGVASEFVNKMNEAYGISKKTLMNAQAIFKNMLGSLGQISDQMAYKLSEGITQMAVDYASLYNVGFEDAFTKFQAALSGQVRPIRSVSGYDITENTIYQLYKELGGTKSVRNLQRTEKQLLGLLAIFDQMQASGAIGDLSKTMESFANQSRVTKEAFSDILSYGGAILTKFLETSGIMTAFNGTLLFVADVLEAVAESMGALEGFGGAKPFESVTESAEDAENAIDKVNGKLLDFDKFRSMSGGEENALGLDQKLLDALSGYSTILGDMTSKANEFAENLKKASGLFDEEGNFNTQKWDDIVGTLEALGNAIVFLGSASVINSIKNFFITLKKGGQLTSFFSTIVISGLVFSITKLVQAFKDGDGAAFAFWAIISGLLISAFTTLNQNAISSAITKLLDFWDVMVGLNTMMRGSFLKGVIGLSAGFIGLGASIVGAFLIIQNWGDMSDWQRIIGIIGVATTAILGLALAFGAFHSAWSLGLATAGIVAGIGMIVASIATIKKEATIPVEYHAMGASDLEGGSLFVAGEHGKTEMVYSGANGKGNVANIQQIKQAQLQALNEWWSNARRDMPQVREVSKTGIYEITKSEAIRRGDW